MKWLATIAFTFSTSAVQTGGPLWTAEETAYLASRSEFRVCADPSYYPFDYIDEEGRHRGIAADLLAEIGAVLGVRFLVVPSTSWTETLDLARAGHCDIVAMLNETPARAEYLAFTRPYVTFGNVIVTHRPAYHLGLASLHGRTLALPRGYRIAELVASVHPEIQILATANVDSSLAAVSRGEAYGTLINMQRLLGDVQRLGLRNLHFAGDAELQDHYRMGVRRDDELLLAILDRALAALPEERISAIMERWYVVPVEHAIPWRLLLLVAGGGAVVVAFLLLHLYHRHRFYALLERRNLELARLSDTDSLTQTANRRGLDARLDAELERSQRYGRPLSVILFDLDRFKAINDVHGHQQGDAILVEAAGLLRPQQRLTDLFGRWGGEEFLVICSETPLEAARVAAERLRAAIEEHAFTGGLRLTISVGVAEIEPGDTPTSLLQRADQALYRAKSAGRNTVHTAPSSSAARQ
jgi:diguanylate cyclase (GGDEF)-like protein